MKATGLDSAGAHQPRQRPAFASEAPTRRRGAAARAEMTTNPLVGTWRLLSWETKRADGTIDYPFGARAVGFIIYTDDGYMSVVIASSERDPFEANDLLGGSAGEKAQAAETYLSYCGRYEYRGDSVVHHVELSLFPNWSGHDQERSVQLRENRLTLEASPLVIRGVEQAARLIWEKV